jgi:DNA replication protein DnaC
MRMVVPGLYGAGSENDKCDLERYEKLKYLSRMPLESRLTSRFSTFEDVKGRADGFQAAIDFVNGKVDPPLLLLYGEPGRSKTYLALAIGWGFVSQLRPVLYYEVVELLDALRRGYKIQDRLSPGEYIGETFDNLMQRVLSYELLILDDLGVENATDWAGERLDHIVNNRFVNRKPTVITSNTLEISERILDRCKEGKIVRLEGESYREIIQRRKKSVK